jgi:uncharacterized protein YbjQ (UPF0145 family)
MARAGRRGPWDSALSAAEFTAIRSAGFEPAGQVLGAAVYPAGWAMGGHGGPGAVIPASYEDPVPAGPPVPGGATVHAFDVLTRTMYTARQAAISRMAAECVALGGQGVVGVSLTIGEFPVEAAGVACLEFTAIGTAVRAGAVPALRTPFTSDLPGQDFAKLIMAGWVPVGLAMGISAGGKPDDPVTLSQRLPRAGSAEMGAWTHLVSVTRLDARHRLRAEVAALGASGVVVRTSDLRVRQGVCPWQAGPELIAEVTLIGTAITPFSRSRTAEPPRSLAVLALDPDRRRAQPPKADRTAVRPGAERSAQP